MHTCSTFSTQIYVHTYIHTHAYFAAICDILIASISPSATKRVAQNALCSFAGRSVGKNLQGYFNANTWDVNYVSRCLNFDFSIMIIKCELVHLNRDTCTSFSRSRFLHLFDKEKFCKLRKGTIIIPCSFLEMLNTVASLRDALSYFCDKFEINNIITFYIPIHTSCDTLEKHFISFQIKYNVKKTY